MEKEETCNQNKIKVDDAGCVLFQALVKYVAEQGYPNERYELLTNFPRKKLSYMDFDITIQEAGLNPQESVFVQARWTQQVPEKSSTSVRKRWSLRCKEIK